jgi:uncharacterized protein (DUF779 family)
MTTGSFVATESAAGILKIVRAERSGTLTITIDSGCCEGTAPHLYENYLVPYGFVEIARVEGIPVLVPPHVSEQWKAANVTLDLIEDSSDALSLETERGVRLFLRYGCSV